VTRGGDNTSIYRRFVAVLLTLLLVGLDARPALAYLKFGVTVNGRQTTLKWSSRPVRYRVSEQSVPGVSATQFRDAVGRAFATWEALPTASITYQFGGFTSALAGDEDGQSTLGFDDRPELDRVLASTSLLVDDVTGELVEADIFFNSAFAWSVAANGEANHYDLETIALHEIGHFSGLGHSALGETELTGHGRRVTSAEAVMFPIAFGPGNVANRTLRADDIAGISDLYPDDGFNDKTGSLSGRVTQNGQGLFGAHIVAFNPRTGQLIASFSLNEQGRFSIAGLTPGPHIVRIEPLDDADPESFFDDSSPVALDFRATLHPRLIVVPKGGDSGTLDVKVSPK
jgi:Matrixin